MIKNTVSTTLVALCFLAACNAASDAQQSDVATEKTKVGDEVFDGASNLHALGIGPVKIGFAEGEIEGLGIPYEKKSVNLEGDEYIKYHLTLPDGVIVSATMSLEGRVYSIATSSTNVKDEYGNGVGSEIADLEKSYPAGRLIKGNADGNYLRFLTATPLIFIMDKSLVPESCFELEVKCDFSKYSKVIGLEVGKYSPK